MPQQIGLRPAVAADRSFLVHMTRLASTLADRPLPAAEDAEVLALLPGRDDGV
jgi:hypothetical protein